MSLNEAAVTIMEHCVEGIGENVGDKVMRDVVSGIYSCQRVRRVATLG